MSKRALRVALRLLTLPLLCGDRAERGNAVTSTLATMEERARKKQGHKYNILWARLVDTSLARLPHKHSTHLRYEQRGACPWLHALAHLLVGLGSPSSSPERSAAASRVLCKLPSTTRQRGRDGGGIKGTSCPSWRFVPHPERYHGETRDVILDEVPLVMEEHTPEPRTACWIHEELPALSRRGRVVLADELHRAEDKGTGAQRITRGAHKRNPVTCTTTGPDAAVPLAAAYDCSITAYRVEFVGPKFP
jgi:hypothetical protein